MLIFLALSSHGFGHLSQVSPIINQLRNTLPEARLIVQSLLEKETIESRIEGKFHYIQLETDVGMIMNGALDVLPEQTAFAYQEFHQNWDEKLVEQIAIYKQYQPDIVIADIPYLPLFAAQQLKIINVAVCSLNWADVLGAYCGNLTLIEQIEDCYARADLFIKPEPAMPMSWLGNLKSVGMLVRPGQARKDEIKKYLGIASEQRLVLVSLGGIDTKISINLWDVFNNTHFIVQENNSADFERVHCASKIKMSFSDIVQSVDAIITKPGYGMIVEAAWGGIPTLYVNRGDWPEEPYLTKWLEKYAPTKEITREQLESGHFKEQLDFVLQQKRHFVRPEIGIDESVNQIIKLLEEDQDFSMDSSQS